MELCEALKLKKRVIPVVLEKFELTAAFFYGMTQFYGGMGILSHPLIVKFNL